MSFSWLETATFIAKHITRSPSHVARELSNVSTVRPKFATLTINQILGPHSVQSETTLGTLRYGDYGLRTTDGRHFRTGTRHMCSVVPTVASSRRCVVEGFHVVQRGVVRGTEDGMKK